METFETEMNQLVIQMPFALGSNVLAIVYIAIVTHFSSPGNIWYVIYLGVFYLYTNSTLCSWH